MWFESSFGDCELYEYRRSEVAGRVQVFKNGSACYWFNKCEVAIASKNKDEAMEIVQGKLK